MGSKFENRLREDVFFLVANSLFFVNQSNFIAKVSGDCSLSVVRQVGVLFGK